LCCVFCLSSFCVLYPMFTAAHSWLSRQFSMFVLCILFVFVLLDTIHRTKTNKIHNTNIENRRDNQEWAAVNIGYNTQNEDKLNKIHNTNIENRRVVYFVCLRSVYCIQCLQLPIPGCPVSFLCLCCVFCFVCLRSVYCIQCLQLPIPGCTQNEDKQNTQHKHIKPTGQPGMGSCKHWIQ
jgi:uncharacterized membrane protein